MWLTEGETRCQYSLNANSFSMSILSHSRRWTEPPVVYHILPHPPPLPPSKQRSTPTGNDLLLLTSYPKHHNEPHSTILTHHTSHLLQALPLYPLPVRFLPMSLLPPPHRRVLLLKSARKSACVQRSRAGRGMQKALLCMARRVLQRPRLLVVKNSTVLSVLHMTSHTTT
jgi:hypothetical protein